MAKKKHVRQVSKNTKLTELRLERRRRRRRKAAQING